MSNELRALHRWDLPELEAFLNRRPVENLFLTSKLAEFGMDRRRLGRVLAVETEGTYAAVLVDGGTVFVTGHDPGAIPSFVEAIGPIRRATSILGPSMMALGLYLGLSKQFKEGWGVVSNVRETQPLMLLTRPPVCAADERVRRLTIKEYKSYLEASIHMYTEEIGSSPFKYGGGYETFVKQRLKQGDAWGIVENGEVIFKADIGPKVSNQAQLQGVWVHPELRGQGLAVPALSGMLRSVMATYPLISLYVNDFNTPAIKAYQRLGFETIGSLSTIHY